MMLCLSYQRTKYMCEIFCAVVGDGSYATHCLSEWNIRLMCFPVRRRIVELSSKKDTAFCVSYQKLRRSLSGL